MLKSAKASVPLTNPNTLKRKLQTADSMPYYAQVNSRKTDATKGW